MSRPSTPTADAHTSPRVFGGRSLSGCFVAMFIVGMLLSVYGPLVPALQARFDLSATAVAAALGIQSVGAVVGVLLAQPLLHRTGNRTTLATSLAAITIGVLVIALAPTWTLVLIGASAAGLGFGGVDSIVTQLILVGSGDKGHTRVNIAHACFGMGTVAGPAVTWVVGAERYPFIFAAAAVLGVVALSTLRSLAPWPTPAQMTTTLHTPAASTARAATVLGAMVIAAFFALYVTHFAVQSGIGNWETTLLTEQSGLSQSAATLATSGYWLMLVVGRFTAAAAARRFGPGTIVITSSTGLAVAVAAAIIPGWPLVAFLIAGLFLGPIFPTGMAWMAQAGFARGNNFAYIIAGSMLGMAAAPTLVGGVIEERGVESVAPVLTAIAVLVAISSLWILVALKRVERTGTRGQAGDTQTASDLASAVDL